MKKQHSDKYRIEVSHLENGEGHKIDVYGAVTGEIITTSTRNYHSALYGLIEDHAGSDWLFVSENYHGGMGAIDLKTGERFIFEPKPSYKGEQFWCLAEFKQFYPEAQTVEIFGCFWTCPFSTRMLDFSDPRSPPYALISEIEEDEDGDGDGDGDGDETA